MNFKQADEDFAKRFIDAAKTRDVDQMREVMWKQDPLVTVGMAGIQRHLLFHVLPLRKAEQRDFDVADVIFRSILRPLENLDPVKDSELLKKKSLELLDVMATIEQGTAGIFTELRDYIERKVQRLFPQRVDLRALANELQDNREDDLDLRP